MSRIHNCLSPLVIKNTTYQNRFLWSVKPNGLWYSIDYEWIDWCRREVPAWVGKYNYLINYSNTAKILKLENNPEVISFHYKYRTKHNGPFGGIDWKKVMDEFDGIEILNYKRLSVALIEEGFGWHYEWFVSSGCVWNLNKTRISYIDA